MNKAPADKISSIKDRPPPPSVFWGDGAGVALGSSVSGSGLIEDHESGHYHDDPPAPAPTEAAGSSARCLRSRAIG